MRIGLLHTPASLKDLRRYLETTRQTAVKVKTNYPSRIKI